MNHRHAQTPSAASTPATASHSIGDSPSAPASRATSGWSSRRPYATIGSSPSSIDRLADLVWASFPCQDLSLAGGGAGLKGERSGTFWPFWDLMTALVAEGRDPSMVVLENVCGTLTAHSGKDFTAICRALSNGGYRFGAQRARHPAWLPVVSRLAVHTPRR